VKVIALPAWQVAALRRHGVLGDLASDASDALSSIVDGGGGVPNAVAQSGGGGNVAALVGTIASGNVGLNALVQRITIDSQLTPTISFDQPFAAGAAAPGTSATPSAGGGGFMSWLLALLKPQVTIQTAAGPAIFAPDGPPTTSYVPVVAAGAAGVLGLGVLGLIGLIRALRRKS
jgi:hypothetical protein